MGSPVQSGLARGKKRRRSSFGSRRSLSPRDASTQLSSNIWLESYWCGHPWRGLLPRPGKGKIDFCPPLSVCSFLLFLTTLFVPPWRLYLCWPRLVCIIKF